jgi:hypothetical protein
MWGGYVRRGSAHRGTVLRGIVALVLAASGVIAGRPAASAAAEEWPGSCLNLASPIERADDLLANRYTLSPHPTVTLPADLKWSEDPLKDSNWRFQLHTLRFTQDLLRAWTLTGNGAYSDRALVVLRDWYDDNPRADPPSTYSWNDHSTAWRAMTYACTADLLGVPTWLGRVLDLHGQVLASPTFYVGHGNHALNQAIGLLEVGRVRHRSDWTTLARDRLNKLVVESVDSQGVSNEQSLGYQVYNYDRYMAARSRLLATGLQPGYGFARVELMPRLLAQGSLPNGELEMLGDTDRGPVPNYPGTATEFVATQGASGTRPDTISAWQAGYMFVRTGWGEQRAFTDESFVSMQWGPGARAHGHADGQSITLYGWGSRLLVDPGKYTYNAGAWRSWFTGRRSANVVTVDGLAWDRSAPTTLLGRSNKGGAVDVRMRSKGYPGVTYTRRVSYMRRLDYVLVEDRLVSSVRRTYRQLWHLRDGSAPVIAGSSARTTSDRGNVLIRQLATIDSQRIVTGAASPIQGWISYEFNRKVAAPVVEVVRRGTSVRFLTLIVPAEGDAAAEITGLRLTSDGYQVTVTIGGHSDRVVVAGTVITVTSLD